MAPAGSDRTEDRRIDRLLDAIELVKANRREEARHILRELIREDKDFESAWLWMSVAVDSVDQSIICLDNVLRINPDNADAATALYHLRKNEAASQKRRDTLRYYRDITLVALWALIMILLFAILISSSADFLRGA
jgi:tetratricopeptide (TPR) repeat protein